MPVAKEGSPDSKPWVTNSATCEPPDVGVHPAVLWKWGAYRWCRGEHLAAGLLHRIAANLETFTLFEAATIQEQYYQ